LVNFVSLVDFVRTRTLHQVSLLEWEISHKVHKRHKVHKVAGDGTPLSPSGQAKTATERRILYQAVEMLFNRQSRIIDSHSYHCEGFLMLRPGAQIGPYILTGKLGRGSFGVVWLAEKRTPLATTRVALKIPHDDELDMDAIKQEAALWARASGHPNVIPIIEANIYDEQIVIASEYASEGSMQDWLNRHGGAAPSIDLAVRVMFGILDGLEHLHTQQIIHRDLKPSNLLLQGQTPRIADFGISRIIKTTSQSITIAGTYAYMAPEAFDGRRNEQTDLWAAGVIFYQMLTGRLPFPQKDSASLMAAILNKSPEPMPVEISGRLQTVIARSLDKHPTQRFKSASEMRSALSLALRPEPMAQRDTSQDRHKQTDDPLRKVTLPDVPEKKIVERTLLQRNLQRLKIAVLTQLLSTIFFVTLTIIIVDPIVVTAVILSLSGLTTMVYSIRCGLLRGALFGLSGILISVLCVALILLNDWRPYEAQEPIAAILFYYGVLLALPLGIASLIGVKRLKKRLSAKPAAALQPQR
jgi:serine/threonine protein kinase